MLARAARSESDAYGMTRWREVDVSGRVIVDDEADEETDDITTDIVARKAIKFQTCPSCITQHEQKHVQSTLGRRLQPRYLDPCRQLGWRVELEELVNTRNNTTRF